MSLNSDRIKILHVSDVHLFHPRNDTVATLGKLRTYVFNKEVDMIVFVGDVFDRLIELTAEPMWPFIEFINDLLRFAQTYDIVLRFLKGTTRHDWNQNRIFDAMAKALRISSSVRVVEDISIEYIERFDLNILYVPDEASPTAEITQERVAALLKSHGLEKVDVAFMHGAFTDQLPFPNEHMHSIDFYESIVVYFISIGHVHVRSHVGIRIAQGSFDRSIHGEEHPKGLHITTIDKQSRSYSTEFIENKEATVFMTVNVANMDAEEALRVIDLRVKDLPQGSNVRYECAPTDTLYHGLVMLKRRHLGIRWSRLVTRSKKSSAEPITALRKFTPIQLVPENLAGILIARVMAKHPYLYTEEQIAKVITPHL